MPSEVAVLEQIAVLEQSDSRKAEVQSHLKESAPCLSNGLYFEIRCFRSLCFLQPCSYEEIRPSQVCLL
ncbi:hypothetical protein CLU79DRAFT_756847 [Phycomyces nitens]|nr:hypothetical protein CLU79DRAFT_756847 [Phycomyces nitens]